MKSLNTFLLLFFVLSVQSFSQQFVWVERNSPVSSRLNCINGVTFNFTCVWICGDNGVILKTRDYGLSFINQTGHGVPPNINLINVCAFDTNNVVVTGKRNDTSFVFRTTNSGLNWSVNFIQVSGSINAITRRANYNQQPYGLMVGNPVANRWSIWATTNSGLNWDSTGRYLPSSGSEIGEPSSLYYLDSSAWFGTNNYKVYYSNNNGRSWTAQMVVNEQTPSGILFVSWYPSSLGMVGGTVSIFETTNSGQNWTLSLFQSPGSGRITSFVNHPGGVVDYPCCDNWLVRGDSNIYHIGFNTWSSQFTAPAGHYTYVAEGNSNSHYSPLLAVRDNGGISYCECPIWGAVKKQGNEIPDEFQLSQNYPNPFNPVTKIKFNTPPLPSPKEREQSHVELIVYDILGREIATLVNENLNPGTYEVEWDGSNYLSGVYFYKLITDSFSQTRKMVLLK